MILIFAIIIFFFVVFTFAKEDFILLRKNISLVTIFDVAIVCGLIGLLTGRIGYVALHYSISFLNPLVFFIIPYFPGLSSGGFLLGTVVSLYFFAKWKKVPTGRVYDIFSFALMVSLFLFFLIEGVSMIFIKTYPAAGEYGMFGLLLLMLFLVMRKVFITSSWKDGSVFFVNTSFTSLFIFASQMIPFLKKPISREWPYFLALFFILFASFLVRLLKKSGERV